MASSRNDGFSEPGRVSIWRKFVKLFALGTGSNQGTKPTLENVTENNDEQGINGEQNNEEDLIKLEVECEERGKELQSENCEKLKNARERVIKLEDEVRRLNQEIQLVKEENGDLKKDTQSQEKNIDATTKMERLLNKMRNEIDELRQENNRKNNDIQKLQQENTNMNNEIQQLQQKNTNKNNKIQQLRQENTNKNNDIQQLQQENNNKNDKIQKLQQKNTNKNKKIQQLQQENTNKNNENQELRQENTNKNNENQQLQENNNNKNNEIQQLQEDNNNKNNEIQQLQEDNNHKDNEIERLREENNNEIQQLQQERQPLQENTITESGSVVVSNDALGRGAWGAVYKGDFYGTKVAVKEFHEIIISPYNLQILEREIDIASQCRHPNLLQFICATKNDQDRLLIVTELMDMALRTLLEQRARKKSRLVYQEIKSISSDVALGLNYLHAKKPSPIIHRDVSSANVLLWIENGTVRRAKISDFGSANFMQVCNTPNPGAALYAAPEARRAQHDPKIDVFSYGLLVCEISICELPNLDQVKRKDQISRIPKADIKTLVQACTRKDPSTRPAMQDVIGFWQHMT